MYLTLQLKIIPVDRNEQPLRLKPCHFLNLLFSREISGVLTICYFRNVRLWNIYVRFCT